MEERHERLVDLAVAAAAFIVGGLMAWQSFAREGDAKATLAADVREIEQAGIVQDASMALPRDVRDAIGLEGQPDATPAGVLGELKERIASRPSPTELRLVWVALAASWRQDPLARREIADLASVPAQLERHRATLDELLRLANGRGADDLAQLQATFGGFGASRWLLGHLGERHLANVQDPGASQLAVEISAMAQDAMTRWTLVTVLEMFLLPMLGLVVLVVFPMFMRPRLVARGLAADLGASPFRVERTWRVFLAWFVAFQIAGYVLVIALAALARGAHLIAFTMALQAIASIALARWLIDHWARLPRDERPVPVALGLAKPRVKTILLWLVPGIALAMALVRSADYLNLVLLQRQPDTQSVVQLVIDQGSPALMLLIGLGAVVLAPLAEEIIFRAFLFRNLRDAMGRGLAMLLSGFAFALVHFEPTLVLPLTALGVALALLYEWSGSLYVPIVVHALWNLIALVKIELWRI